MKDLIIGFKGFYQNPNLRFLLIFLVTWKLGFHPIYQTFNFELIKLGHPKEELAQMDLSLVGFNILAASLISKNIEVNKEMDFFKKSYYWRFLFGILLVFVIFRYF